MLLLSALEGLYCNMDKRCSDCGRLGECGTVTDGEQSVKEELCDRRLWDVDEVLSETYRSLC